VIIALIFTLVLSIVIGALASLSFGILSLLDNEREYALIYDLLLVIVIPLISAAILVMLGGSLKSKDEIQAERLYLELDYLEKEREFTQSQASRVGYYRKGTVLDVIKKFVPSHSQLDAINKLGDTDKVD